VRADVGEIVMLVPRAEMSPHPCVRSHTAAVYVNAYQKHFAKVFAVTCFKPLVKWRHISCNRDEGIA